MRVFITGAGLLGCRLAKLLVESGDEAALFDLSPNQDYIASVVDPAKISVIRGDITDLPGLISAARGFRAECVVHTAGLIGFRAAENFWRTFQVNVVGSNNVGETARVLGVKRLVYCSTIGVYDFRKPEEAPVAELFTTGPAGSPYGSTKLAAEQILLASGKSYGYEVLSLRFASVYGRGTFVGGSWIGAAINGLVEAALAGQEMVLKPPFNATEYIYVKDAARALHLAVHTPTPKEQIFNIGSGEITSPQQLVSAITELVPGARLSLDPALASAAGRRFPYDLSRAKAELGYEPSYGLKAGLQDYLAEIEAQRR